MPPLSNSLHRNELSEGPTALAASGQRSSDAAGQHVAANVANSSALTQLVEVWPNLPPHIREAILTLVDAAGIKLPGVASKPAIGRNESAWRAARDCRYIVQDCLREEEWKDADEEFYEVIREAFSR